MKYTKAEARHFYWHCVTAALLIENLENNTAANAHVTRAIRMATLTAAGKDGVHFASRGAHDRRPSPASDWAGLGLIKEHVVPVSVIALEVREVHRAGTKYVWRQLVHGLTQHDLENWQVIDSDEFLEQEAPLSALVAFIVRRSTKLAWITKEENTRLSRQGLTKVMPLDHGDDLLARYKACKIELIEL